MKNMFDKRAVEKLVQRVQQLSPQHTAKWGSMNATEMLTHCNKIHEYLLTTTTPSDKKTTLKQYIARYIVLYLLPHLPRNIMAPKAVHTKGLVNAQEYETQKDAFINYLRKFPGHQQPIRLRHPYFGNINTRQWGIAAWKHNDHHLRQFGL